MNPNMEHCQFENTYDALLQVRSTLQNLGSLRAAIDQATHSRESNAVSDLVCLCKEIAEGYSDELDNL